MTISRRKALKRHGSRRRRAAKNWCQIYILQEAPGMPAHYVGQTRQLPAERLRWHFKELERQKATGRRLTGRFKWLDDLQKRGISPTIDVIDDSGIWDISEAVWIDRLLRDGHPLLNVASVVP